MTISRFCLPPCASYDAYTLSRRPDMLCQQKQIMERHLPCWGAVWAQCVRVVSPRVRGRLGRKDSELKPTCCSCQVLQVEIAAKHASYAGINEPRVTNQLKVCVWCRPSRVCVEECVWSSSKREEERLPNQPTIQLDFCRQQASV